MLTIRKYPNRRLYDTSKSSYITLGDVRALVLSNTDFQVVDSKTEEDLTQIVLLQIITEAEGNPKESLLTTRVLRQLIQFYGNGMQGMMRDYLEQSMSTFLEQQDMVQNLMRNMMEVSPLNMMGKLVDQNLNAWKKLTKNNKNAEENTSKNS